MVLILTNTCKVARDLRIACLLKLFEMKNYFQNNNAVKQLNLPGLTEYILQSQKKRGYFRKLFELPLHQHYHFYVIPWFTFLSNFYQLLLLFP